MTQLDMLRNHFSQTPSITGVEAAAVYKIRALPRRISDLEAQGWWRKDPAGQRYKKYTVLSTP
jgi:hypothetical protein